MSAVYREEDFSIIFYFLFLFFNSDRAKPRYEQSLTYVSHSGFSSNTIYLYTSSTHNQH